MFCQELEHTPGLHAGHIRAQDKRDWMCVCGEYEQIVLSISGCDSGGVQFLSCVSDRSSVSGPGSGLSGSQP